jgi:hypothetical protein
MDGNSTGGVRRDLSRADLILILIPLVFLGSYSTILLLDTSLIPAVGASIACCLLIGDGLFWHPP